jgi:hypothetical protein
MDTVEVLHPEGALQERLVDVLVAVSDGVATIAQQDEVPFLIHAALTPVQDVVKLSVPGITAPPTVPVIPLSHGPPDRRGDSLRTFARGHRSASQAFCGVEAGVGEGVGWEVIAAATTTPLRGAHSGNIVILVRGTKGQPDLVARPFHLLRSVYREV